MSDGEYRGFYWNWIEEWSQFFQPCNWYTFHPLSIEIEDDRHLGGVEATLIVMGIGFRIRWDYAETEDLKEIKRLADKAEREFRDSGTN